MRRRKRCSWRAARCDPSFELARRMVERLCDGDRVEVYVVAAQALDLLDAQVDEFVLDVGRDHAGAAEQDHLADGAPLKELRHRYRHFVGAGEHQRCPLQPRQHRHRRDPAEMLVESRTHDHRVHPGLTRQIIDVVHVRLSDLHCRRVAGRPAQSGELGVIDRRLRCVVGQRPQRERHQHSQQRRQPTGPSPAHHASPSQCAPDSSTPESSVSLKPNWYGIAASERRLNGRWATFSTAGSP